MTFKITTLKLRKSFVNCDFFFIIQNKIIINNNNNLSSLLKIKMMNFEEMNLFKEMIFFQVMFDLLII